MSSICEMQGLNFFNNVKCTGLNFDTYFFGSYMLLVQGFTFFKMFKKVMFHLLPFLLLLIPGAVW